MAAGLFKRIEARRWDNLRDAWVPYISKDAVSGVEIFEAEDMFRRAGISALENDYYDDISGLRANALAEMAAFRAKAEYCIRTARVLDQSGNPTWAAMARYDGTYFFARALIQLLGVQSYSRTSNRYINLFEIQKIRSKVLDIGAVGGHRIIILKDRPTHEMVWGILNRLVRVTTGPPGAQKYLRAIADAKLNVGFTQYRNRYMYMSFPWSRDRDHSKSDLLVNKVYDEAAPIISDNPESLLRGVEASRYKDELYTSAIYIVEGLLNFLLSDLGRLIGTPDRIVALR